MKVCSGCHETKEFSAFSKRLMSRDGAQSKCKLCAATAAKQWRHSDPERAKACRKTYYQSHLTQIIETSKTYYRLNSDKVKESNRVWRQTHPDKALARRKVYHQTYYVANSEKIKKRNKEWFKTNPHKVAEYRRSRDTAILLATPKWFEEELVKEIYLKRDELNDKYKVKLVVDHIIPINPRDKSVCGLHCWANLQLLDTDKNNIKNDSYQTDW